MPTKTTYKIPAVAKTALLSATNFCRMCPRFKPATDDDKSHGNTYGSCLRSGEIGCGDEVWQVVPGKATVGRCRYYIEDVPAAEPKVDGHCEMKTMFKIEI